MRSRIPKVLHPLAGRPLILHVLDALAAIGVERPVVVTGHGAEAVEAAVEGSSRDDAPGAAARDGATPSASASRPSPAPMASCS